MILELKDVKKTYHMGEVDIPVLHGISIKIKEGEFMSIVGQSGSGKSTLLNLIGLLDTPTSGKIFLEKKDVSRLSENNLARSRRNKIGFVFQKYNLIEKLSALENVTFPMWLTGLSMEKRVEHAKKLLKLVGLEKRLDHKPSELSGGESQRVAIARALSNNPSIILADEPTGNLDSKTSKEIIDLLIDLHKKQKVTLIMVTHDQKISSRAKHRIHIKDGLVIKEEKR